MTIITTAAVEAAIKMNLRVSRASPSSKATLFTCIVIITVAPSVFAAIVAPVTPEVMVLMLVNVLVLSVDVAVCFGDVVTAMLRLFNDI